MRQDVSRERIYARGDVNGSTVPKSRALAITTHQTSRPTLLNTTDTLFLFY